MSKFKVGDEVYYLSEVTGNKRIGIVTHTSNHPKPNSVWAKWGGEKIDSWMPEDKVFFVTPPKPTGFEVGKKYSMDTSQEVFEVLGISHTYLWYKNIRTGIHVTEPLISTFVKSLREYIPPPPEEWRIVYKDRYGDVTVGKVPFKSESEALASRWYTDHKSSALKAIRVDA